MGTEGMSMHFYCSEHRPIHAECDAGLHAHTYAKSSICLITEGSSDFPLKTAIPYVSIINYEPLKVRRVGLKLAPLFSKRTVRSKMSR